MSGPNGRVTGAVESELTVAHTYSEQSENGQAGHGQAGHERAGHERAGHPPAGPAAGGTEGPPVLVPSGLNPDLTRAWIALLRTIGDALQDDPREHPSKERIAEALGALLPNDTCAVGRVEPGAGIVWVKPAEEDHAHDGDELAGLVVPIDDPVVEAVLRDGVPVFEPHRLVVPLRFGRRMTGVVDVRHAPPWQYTQDHLAAASLLGEQLGPLIELMHQYKQEALARRRLASLIEISRAISHSLDLDEILPVIGRSLTEALGLPACAIFLRDEESQCLIPTVTIGEELAGLLAHAAKKRAAIDSLKAERGFPVVPLDDPARAPVLKLRAPAVLSLPPEVAAELEAAGVVPPARVLAVPLVVRDRLRGMAVLPVRDDARAFGEPALAMAMGIAQSAGVAIEHAQLYARARELGVVEERNRLAREVHDTLAQGLTAIALQLDAAERLLPPGAEAKRIVGEAREQARRSLDEARRAVWGLSPLTLDGGSLPEALREEAVRFERRTGIVTQFSADAEAAPLSEEQATALLRVAQEALHNVEKHAAPSRVRVELQHDASTGRLTLLVADDGAGFDRRTLPGPDGGFGLSGMRERMRLAGGDLEVESSPGWGTRVRARLTVDAANAEPAPAAEQPPTTIRVLLVDDHPLAREGLRRLLDGREDVAVLGEAADGAEGVERALALRPDVVLMDLQMPRLSGVGAVQALRDQWPDARVLILTTFAQDEHLFEGLRAGARGYLLKDAGSEELIAAIKTVHAGGSLVQPAMAARLLDRFGELATRERLPEPLTDREVEILRLVATGDRNKEIADRLVLSEKTVKNALSRLYGKLGAASRAEAVARGRALGLLPLDAAQFVPGA